MIRARLRRMADEELPYRYTAALANELEQRWQRTWLSEGTYRQPNPGEAGFDAGRPKFYCLDMFPYPSGAGLHVGHPEGYTATDIISRYKRMRGFNVLHPMGWDAFGLPAEQYALRTGVHPAVTTRQAIDNFRRQLQRFGFSYDWSREFGTIDPEYYRFTQWIFLQLYNAWFDPEQQRARPIRELVQAFEDGARTPCWNPDAAEVSDAQRAENLGPWDAIKPPKQRKVLDSWRLAYLADQVVNWCPQLGTALANEEVIDGRSERGDFPVLRKPLRQWMFRITAYGERLLSGLDEIDWPEATKTKQRLWIGRSAGALVDFALQAPVGAERKLRVFTTRPDTLFGATYMVVAPEHPLVEALLDAPCPETDAQALGSYVEQARNRSDLERQTDRKKTGVDSGVRAINPATGRAIPVWVADYVLMGYGTGAIMAVPAHDDRDHEFAEAFGLDIVTVVAPPDGMTADGCFSEDGCNVNSENDSISLNGMATVDAKRAITAWLTDRGLGTSKVNYRLRDWLFSRQRYWGEPFPIAYDHDGQHYPLRPETLPLMLPELSDYQPEESEEPRPLLAKARDWVHTTAGDAGVEGLPPNAPVTRETNTMPGWAGSCWYFLRYCDPRNAKAMVGDAAQTYWLGNTGVDLYIGGAEHAVLHLMYARFWHQALHDLGHIGSREPFQKLFHQGVITSHAYQRTDGSLVPVDEVDEPEEGRFIEITSGAEVKRIVAKMSKTLKNVVNPDDVIGQFGADTFRLYEMYMGPLDASKPWNTRDIGGQFRFLQRTWRLLVSEQTGELNLRAGADQEVERLLHRTIAKVEQDIERLAFNTAIAALVKFVNKGTSSGGLTRDQTHRFVRALAPFAPHIAEELWHKLGEATSIALAQWPTHDSAMLIDDTVELPISIKGKVRSRIQVPADADKATLEAAALADGRIKELIGDRTVRKVIVVPGKMVNIVI